jgi:large subunit ribosomal protein L25
VLIRELQVDPRSAGLLHVDLFAVNLQEKLTVDVPVVAVGEAPAVAELKIGVLQQILNTLKVECLPGDIPAQLNVDVGGLAEIDDGIHIRDIALPPGVSLAHGIDPEELVLKIAPLRVVEEEPVVEAEAAPEEGAEGGEAPAADGDSGASPDS